MMMMMVFVLMVSPFLWDPLCRLVPQHLIAEAHFLRRSAAAR